MGEQCDLRLYLCHVFGKTRDVKVGALYCFAARAGVRHLSRDYDHGDGKEVLSHYNFVDDVDDDDDNIMMKVDIGDYTKKSVIAR